MFASVLGAPQNAKDFPSVKVVPVYAVSPGTQKSSSGHMAQRLREGWKKLKIPIGRKLPLNDAEQGHAAVAKGGAGKLLLVVDKE